MHTDAPVLSPARRAQRFRAAMFGCLLLGAAAVVASDWARADIFLTTGPHGEAVLSDRPPLSGSAIVVATSGGNAAASSSTAPMPEVAPAPADAPTGDVADQPPAQAEPFRPGGTIAPGKSFTAGD